LGRRETGQIAIRFAAAKQRKAFHRVREAQAVRIPD
jgi:hypothetical protein